jgi:hypothetical protein
MASAKQLAARKRFSAIMKSGGFKKRKTKAVRKTRTVKRKSVTTKRKSTPLKRVVKRRPVMKRRSRTIRRRTSSMGKGIGSSLKTGMIGEIVKGIGAGSLATLVVGRVAPQYAPIASIGAGFLTGGIVGGAANLLLSGGLSSIGGLFGGASTPQQEFGV